MKVKKDFRLLIKLLILFLGIVIFLSGIFNNYNGANLSALYVLIIIGELIFLSKKNLLLLLLFIFLFYFNYSIVFADYLHIIKGTMFTMFAGTDVANKGIYILLLFWIIILAFFKCNISDFNVIGNKDLFIYEKKNDTHRIIVYGIYIVLILIFILGFRAPETKGARGAVSPIYEYSTIFIILCFYLGNRYKECRIISSLILIMFALQNFIYGGRVTGVQLLIILYVFMFSYKYSLKKVFPIAIRIVNNINNYRWCKR